MCPPVGGPLTRSGFTPTWLWPSRAWAEAYFEKRGVPADRPERERAIQQTEQFVLRAVGALPPVPA